MRRTRRTPEWSLGGVTKGRRKRCMRPTCASTLLSSASTPRRRARAQRWLQPAARAGGCGPRLGVRCPRRAGWRPPRPAGPPAPPHRLVWWRCRSPTPDLSRPDPVAPARAARRRTAPPRAVPLRAAPRCAALLRAAAPPPPRIYGSSANRGQSIWWPRNSLAPRRSPPCSGRPPRSYVGPPVTQ